MYTPVSARETGGVMSTVLIPTRFVWAYGGRSVFLTGSFNGWAELLPMSPVEGCPTVFQVICRLMPGYHEYKFFVDGQWRNDENQPLVNSSYGMVNSVFRDREGGYISTNTNQQMVSGSNMDVDTMAFRRMVRITESAAHEVVPRITETDLADTRQRIAIFLSGRTVYEMLPDSGKVIALDIQLPVKQAFHILFEQGISVAPLWDFSKGQFVGVLSSSDFILILREIGSHGSNMTEEELETHTISAWKEGKAYMNRLINDHIGQFRKHLIHAGPYENLRDVTKKIMQNGVATIPVIHSNSEDGSFPQLLHLASLSGILKCICRYFKHSSSSLPILELPVYSVPLGTWAPSLGDTSGRPLAMLRPSASLSSALNLLVEANVSSLPVVDENNSLLDIYSRSDITALAKDRVYANINLDEMTLHQALQLVHNSYSSPHEYSSSSQRCQMCLRSDSLYKVMERLSNPVVRRLVVVEAGSRRVEGIVSLSDIFRLLLG